MEDRIIMDEPELSPLSKYVNEIHAQYDSNLPRAYFLYLKKRADELNISIYFYDEEKYFASQNKNRAMDLSELNGEEADEKTVIPAVERNPDIGTKMLLALSIYGDEKMRETLKQNLSNIEGIDEFLRRKRYGTLDELIKQSMDKLESIFQKYEKETYIFVGVIRKVEEELRLIKSIYTDPFNRTILHNFIKAMKRNKAKNVEDFVKKKLGIEKEITYQTEKQP